MRKLRKKDFKHICLVILASIPIGFINYFVISSQINQKSSKPSIHGGYIGDGDMSYCKNIVGDVDRILSTHCWSEHQESPLRAYPFLLQFISFGLFPIGYIAFYLFAENKY